MADGKPSDFFSRAELFLFKTAALLLLLAFLVKLVWAEVSPFVVAILDYMGK